MVEVLESGELTAFCDFIKYTTFTEINSDQEDRLCQRVCRWSPGNKSCPVTSQIIPSIQTFAEIMADCFLVLPPLTKDNAVILGKNSQRPTTEVQEVIYRQPESYPEDTKLQVHMFYM